MNQTPPPRGGWSTTKVAIRSVGGCVVHRTGRIVDIDSTTQAATWSGGSYHQDVSSRGGRPTSQVATRLDAGCVVDQTPLQGGWSTTQARGRSGAECVVRQTPLPWGVWSTTQEATYVVDQTPPSRCVWSTAHAATRWDGGLCTSMCCGPDAALAGRAVDRTDRDLQCEASWLRVRSLRVAKVYGGFLNLGRIAGSLWRPLGACQGIW